MLGSNLWSLHYNLAESNPFLYRGYYYDRETGFYYLRSRYYDPVIGRFLNADIHINANGDLIGYNMYAYCSNNPVMNVDPSGEVVWEVIASIVAVVLVVAVACIKANNIANDIKGTAENGYELYDINQDMNNEMFWYTTNALLVARNPNTPIIDDSDAYEGYGERVSKASERIQTLAYIDSRVEKMLDPEHKITQDDVYYLIDECRGHYDVDIKGQMATNYSTRFLSVAIELYGDIFEAQADYSE